MDKALEVSRFIPSDTERTNRAVKKEFPAAAKRDWPPVNILPLEKYSVDGTAELDVTDDSFVSLIILEGFRQGGGAGKHSGVPDG